MVNIQFYFLREAITEIHFAIWQLDRFYKFQESHDTNNKMHAIQLDTMGNIVNVTMNFALQYLIAYKIEKNQIFETVRFK